MDRDRWSQIYLTASALSTSLISLHRCRFGRPRRSHRYTVLTDTPKTAAAWRTVTTSHARAWLGGRSTGSPWRTMLRHWRGVTWTG